MESLITGSFLIFGGSGDTRENKVLSTFGLSDFRASADVRVLDIDPDKKSIGIDQIRESLAFLREKPFAEKRKVLVIREADRLTVQAQNAFLKTLEEPPSYALIILISKTKKDLLDTIVSRCRHIEVRGRGLSEKETDAKDIAKIEGVLEMDPGDRLDWAKEEAKEERKDLVEMLETWVIKERTHLKRGDTRAKIAAKNIEKMLEIKEDLEKTNVNAQLGLEVLVLNLEDRSAGDEKSEV